MFDRRTDDKISKRLCLCEELKRRSNPTFNIILKLFGLLQLKLRNDVKRKKFCLPFFVHRLPRPAFTLAEVLITLGIIGVVAALTIPTLIANYQKQQTVVQLKKAYTIINQAILASIVDNGDPKTWDWRTTSPSEFTAAPAVVNEYIVPYLKVSKNCGLNFGSNECAVIRKKTFNKSLNYPWNSVYHIILNDGTYLGMHYNSFPNVSDLIFAVDVNGEKPPNALGKDIFVMSLLVSTGKFGFRGYALNRDTLLNDALYGCSNSATTYGGVYCGALIQKDNWEIKYSYP